MPNSIFSILCGWYVLGFDDYVQAAEAILTHDDWQTRWDLSEATIDDLTAVNAWREAVLLNNRVNGLSNDILSTHFGLKDNDLFGRMGNIFNPKN